MVVQQDICNGCGYCVSGCPYGVIDRRPTTAGPRSARCATTGCAAGWNRPAPRPARPNPSSSARWTSCANAPPSGWMSCTTRASRGQAYGHDPTTGWAATARSSCCWTSPRCTGCRRTPWCPPVTWPDLEVRGLAAAALVAAAVSAFLAAGGHGDRRSRRAPAGGREPGGAGRPAGEVPSYYGRPVLKPPVWEWRIPAYFFTGGLSAGSALLRRAPT